MIISHKYKFIFLKTTKTAGTSIEIALSKYLGPDDVITSLVPEDEKFRRKLGFCGAQNHLAPIWKYGWTDMVKLFTKGKRKRKFFSHISAKEVKGIVGDEVWNDYYKFCFERNPWDRVISWYYWRNKKEPRQPLTDFIESPSTQRLKRKGYGIYTINGEVAVDRVCRFEEIAEEIEYVRKRVGIPEEVELPRTKSSFRKDKVTYRDLMNSKNMEYIEGLFKEEIEMLLYKW